MRHSREPFSSRSKAACEYFRDLTLHPSLALAPLKRKAATRDTRAPRVPSIVGSFFPPPWLASVADSVALDACPLVREALQRPLAATHEDAQNGNRRATIPDWPEAAGTAEPSPTCGGPARL